MALADEKYMLFTTFRRDGRAVATPVWLVALSDTTFGFTTIDSSGKCKRLRHTSRVTVQACDRRGRATHGPVYDGTARIVTGDTFAQIRQRVQRKYPLMSTLITLAGKVFGGHVPGGDSAARVGVVVTLTATP